MSGFRHYLPEGSPPPDPAASPPSPRPGNGRVWLNGGDENSWWAFSAADDDYVELDDWLSRQKRAGSV